MKKIDIKLSIEINASASKAWEIIGPKFLNIADFGRGVYKSWENVSAPKNYRDAPAGGRYCDVAGFGKFDEQIIHFDPKKNEISWSATGEKLPKFIIGLQNALNVKVIDENKCQVTSNITANLKGFRGIILGAVIKKNFTKTLNGFLEDLKIYTETGNVSEVKQKEFDKAKL